MNTYDTVNEILVNLFNNIWDIEEKAIITEEFFDITTNDMHIINAVGLGDGNNMTTIAKKLNITVGALTTAMNSLVRKGYVVRERSEKDRRIVNILLTQKGEKAFHQHDEFHKNMVSAVMEGLSDLKSEDSRALIAAMNRLVKFFNEYNHKPN